MLILWFKEKSLIHIGRFFFFDCKFIHFILPFLRNILASQSNVFLELFRAFPNKNTEIKLDISLYVLKTIDSYCKSGDIPFEEESQKYVELLYGAHLYPKLYNRKPTSIDFK